MYFPHFRSTFGLTISTCIPSFTVHYWHYTKSYLCIVNCSYVYMVFHKISTVVYRIFCLAFMYSWTNNCRMVIVIWYVTRPSHIWVCLHSLEFMLCYNVVTLVGWVLGCMSLSADNIILHTWMYAILSMRLVIPAGITENI